MRTRNERGARRAAPREQHAMSQASSVASQPLTSGQPPPSSIPLASQELLHPTDMEVEVEDSLLMDPEAPAEKTDADFFNGARVCICSCTARRAPGHVDPWEGVKGAPSPAPRFARPRSAFSDESVRWVRCVRATPHIAARAQISATILMTRTWTE